MTGRALAALLAAALAGPAAAHAADPHGSGHGAAPAAGHGAPPAAGHGEAPAAGHGGHGATAARTTSIGMGAFAFLPPHVDVLAGDTVTWRNGSVRRHTVSAPDGSWDLGVLLSGDEGSRTFAATGTSAYFCRLHAGMAGHVAVHRLLLDRPAGSAAPGRPFPLTGRAALADGATVTLEADAGGGFAPVGEARVGADGRFAATIEPQAAATYRAAAGGEASPAVTVPVVERAVLARVRRDGRRATITASVTPASPGATVVLQLRLPERFGWWPVARARLDGRGRARFRLRPRRTVPARVVLTLPDGATALGHSAPFRLRGSGRR